MIQTLPRDQIVLHEEFVGVDDEYMAEIECATCGYMFAEMTSADSPLDFLRAAGWGLISPWGWCCAACIGLLAPMPADIRGFIETASVS